MKKAKINCLMADPCCQPINFVVSTTMAAKMGYYLSKT